MKIFRFSKFSLTKLQFSHHKILYPVNMFTASKMFHQSTVKNFSLKCRISKIFFGLYKISKKMTTEKIKIFSKWKRKEVDKTISLQNKYNA